MANENIVSTIAGTVTHQKSAGNLKPMASNGALIANAKRGALIDLSNTQASRVNGPSIKDGKDAAFKAPPQRGGGVAKPLSGTQAPKPPVETRASAVVRTLGTNKTIIYQDDEPNQLKTRMLPQEPITSEDDTKAIYEDAVEELLADATVYQSVEPVNARTCAPVIGEPVAKYPASNIYVDDAEENYSDCYSELDEESFEDEREWSKAEAARYLDYSTYTNTGRIYGMVGTPIVLDRHFQELAAARALIEATESLEEIEEEYGDIGMVREYSEEIFEYMIELEVCRAYNYLYVLLFQLLTLVRFRRKPSSRIRTTWTGRQNLDGPCAQFSLTGLSRSTPVSTSTLRPFTSPSTSSTAS